MSLKQLHCEVYALEVALYVGDLGRMEKALTKAYGKAFVAECREGGWFNDKHGTIQGKCCVVEHPTNKGFGLMLMYINKESPDPLGVVVHECLHGGLRVFGQVGIQLDSGGEEALALFMEWLVKGVWRSL